MYGLRVVLKACLSLALAEANKIVLARGPLLQLLVRALQLFASDAPELATSKGASAGGGGADIASAELAIELLLQLSFVYAEDEDLRTNFMTPATGLTDLLPQLRTNNKLPANSQQSAGLLMGRLTKAPPQAAAPSPSSEPAAGGTCSKNTRHVMLSYCWNAKARPEIVKSLATALRDQGYDVWRDEVCTILSISCVFSPSCRPLNFLVLLPPSALQDGSSILHPMSGNVTDCMAEALEKSAVVIMCVSEQYKDSANCRMEAKYASQLANNQALRILFVMMQENYTTVSKPDRCSVSSTSQRVFTFVDSQLYILFLVHLYALPLALALDFIISLRLRFGRFFCFLVMRRDGWA
jgi:hypothetical protein